MADRILVSGSRDWTDREAVALALAPYADGGESDAILVHGAARGLDDLADLVWSGWGLAVERHPADWNTYGRGAGHRRNAEMVALGADVCLAFVNRCTSKTCIRMEPRGSHGAVGCARLAMQAGIDVVWHRGV